MTTRDKESSKIPDDSPPQPNWGALLSLWRWFAATALAALSIMLLLLPVRPWVPNFDTVEIASGQLVLTDYDEVVLANLDLVAAEPKLWPALRKSAKILRLKEPQYLDRCEVTNREFLAFSAWYQTELKPSGGRILGESESYLFQSRNSNDPIFRAPSRPVSGVTFWDALAYCRAAGGDLPHVELWQAAAGGQEGRIYPWGNAVVTRPWSERIAPDQQQLSCGKYPEARTPPIVPKIRNTALNDMGTNLSEWVVSRDGSAILTGGNQYPGGFDLFSLNALHFDVESTAHDPLTGFRCVFKDQSVTEAGAQTPWNTSYKTVEIPVGDYPVGPPPNNLIGQLLRTLDDRQISQLPRLYSSLRDRATAKHHLMRTEVTRAQYHRFLLDPLVRLGVFAHENEPETNSYVPALWPLQQRDMNGSVHGIDFWDAYAFAHWAGGRLPTAAEWRWAAGEGDRRIYPWGLSFRDGAAATLEEGLNEAALPMSYEEDVSWSGAFDMAGNLSEWTSDTAENAQVGGVYGSGKMVVKGGNFRLSGAYWSLIGAQTAVPKDFRSDALGFRVIWER